MLPKTQKAASHLKAKQLWLKWNYFVAVKNVASRKGGREGHHGMRIGEGRWRVGPMFAIQLLNNNNNNNFNII